MLAMVLNAPGELRLKELPPPVCPEGGLLLAVHACGLCASDVKMWSHGHKELALPRILGHEVVGRVIECGAPQGREMVGRLVQVAPGMACGVCPDCLAGAHNRCPQVKVLGFSLDGGLAQLMALPRQALACGAVNPLPPGLAAREASLAEPLACALNALAQARLLPGERVAVVGAGVLGRLLAWAALVLGAGAVALVERDPTRLTSLECPGVDASMDDPVSALLEALGGPAQVAVPACPDPQALDWGWKALAPGGRLVIFSGLGIEQPRVDLNTLHYREQTLVGAYGCASEHNRQALRMLARPDSPAARLVTHDLDLKETTGGLELMKNRQALKVVIHPQQGTIQGG
jgi:L-iditol 2-dehydrogenase